MKFSLMDYGLLTLSFNRQPHIFSYNSCLCIQSCQKRSKWNNFVIEHETNFFYSYSAFKIYFIYPHLFPFHTYSIL